MNYVKKIRLGYDNFEVLNLKPWEPQQDIDEYFVIARDGLLGDEFLFRLKDSCIYKTEDTLYDFHLKVAENYDQFMQIMNYLQELSENRTNPVEFEKNPLDEKNIKELREFIQNIKNYPIQEYWMNFLNYLINQ